MTALEVSRDNLPPWAQSFFSGTNLVNVEQDWTEFMPWFDEDYLEGSHTFVCLPFKSGADELEWYVGVHDERAARSLNEELDAFVGTTYARVESIDSIADEHDEPKRAFFETFDRPIFRVTPNRAEDGVEVVVLLTTFHHLVSRRPKLTKKVRRSVGITRREFDRALLAMDEAAAISLLDEMRKSGRLSSENHLYLEIRLDAGLCKWGEVANDFERLSQLKGLHLPTRVFVDVADSIYEEKLKTLIEVGDAATAQQEYKRAGYHTLGMPFYNRRGLKKPSVLTVLLLYESTRTEPDMVKVREMLSLFASVEDARVAEAIKGLFAETTTILEKPVEDEEQAVLAEESFDDDDYEKAFRLYVDLPQSKKILSRLIRCAQEIGTPEAASRVSEIAESVGETLVGQLSDAVREKLEDLARRSEADIDDWLSWARQCAIDPSNEEVRQQLNEECLGWDLRKVLADDVELSKFVDVIERLVGDDPEVMQDAMPKLFEAIEEAVDTSSNKMIPIYALLQFWWSSRPAYSSVDLQLLANLTEAILQSGPDPKQYSELIDNLMNVMTQSDRSMPVFEWGLGVAELLSGHITPDKGEGSLRFFTNVKDVGDRFRHRIRSYQRRPFNMLCKDFDIDLPVDIAELAENEDHQDGDEFSRLEGKKIAIYTLDLSSADRAKDYLDSVCGDVDVTTNSDSVCTERLKSLAKSADIFVFVSRSAKHPAFFCIKENRPIDMTPLLYAQGKGSSSILRVLGEVA